MGNRKKYTYEEHLKRTVGNCQTGCIELRKEENGITTVKLIRSTCKSIHCKHCSHLKAQRYYNRAKAILECDNFRFLTLTSSSSGKSIGSHLKSMLKSWKLFMKELKKFYPRLQYIRVIERHKSGFIHFHACINSYIPQPQLLQIWRKYEVNGFAYIISVPNERQSKYICKYITKQEYVQDETSKSLYDNSARIFQSSQVKITNSHKSEYYFYRKWLSFSETLDFFQKKINENIFCRSIPKTIKDSFSEFVLIPPELYQNIYLFPT